ncbi:replication protein [Thermus tengchongensis]|uniref:replication protein n=1 Tax=Thermus tengchongensis TaxID=1214928 RepID=UPI001432FFCD|nr:replication protein [Thermus tengchongensis]
MGARIGWTHLESPNGFTLIPNPLLNKLFGSGFSDREFAVFLALATRRNLHHKKASTKDLALLLKRDPRTVEKALLALWEKGLVERDATGWWLSDAPPGQDLQAPVHAVQTPLQALQGTGEENALQDGLLSVREIKEKETTTEEKNPPHPHAQAAEAAEAEEVEEVEADRKAPEEKAVSASLPEGGKATFLVPSPSPAPSSSSGSSPALVNEGTKYRLQARLKEAGLWVDFYRVFRPGFAHGGLWRAYLERLEREALPLGEAFLQALGRTLEGARLGVVRYPAAYLDRLLQDLAPPERSSPPPPSLEEVPKDALLLLPDGRRGYFAGWTGGGAKAFVEVDGVAYLVDRESVLRARVLG